MARPNQGIFYEHLRTCREVENEYRKLVDDYFDINNNLIDGSNFISGFAYAANDLYIRSYNEGRSLVFLLQSIKFEEDENRRKYHQLSEKMFFIANAIYDRYHEALGSYSHSGLSPAESTTVDSLPISGPALE